MSTLARDESRPSTGIDAALAAALRMLESGRLGDAEAALQRLRQQFPESPALLHAVARAALQADSPQRALGPARRAAAAEPEVAAYVATLAQVQRRLGRTAEARANLEKAIALDPRDALSHKTLGDLLAEANEPADAGRHYQQAIDIDPGLAEAHNNLGNVLQQQGEIQAAAENYHKALALNPGLIEARCNRAALRIRTGHVDDAIAELREAVRVRPSHAPAHAQLGGIYAARGQPAESAEHYRLALATAPDDPGRLLDLAELLLAHGRGDDAVALMKRALALDPTHVKSHRRLGAFLAERGALDAAIEHLRNAVEIEPLDAAAHQDLGVALQAQGSLDDAILHYRRALALDPGRAVAQVNIGSICERREDVDAAIAAYREAIRIDPSMAEAHSNLGNLLNQREENAEAYRLLRRAIELKPQLGAAHNNLGNVQQERGQFDRAIASYQRALAIDPALAQAAHNLGAAHQQLGQAAEARRLYERAIAIRPDFTRSLLGLVSLDPAGTPPEILSRITTLVEEPGLRPNERSELLFALAKHADATGDVRAAFAWAERANEIDRRRGRFDPLATRQQADRCRRVFTRTFFESRSAYGSRSALPTFIVGLPRSGTTLVEQILASHPAVAGAGELPFIARIAGRIRQTSRATRGYPEGVAQLTEPEALRLAGAYLSKLRRYAGESARVVDKMPFNFMRIGFIRLLFPNARIIHCRRDPLDVFVSGYFLRFRDPISYTCDQADFAQYYEDYSTVMEHWHDVLPSAIMTVQYEDLVARHEDVSRRLVAFCGLEWDDACLRFYENPRPVRTASSQVRQPIYRSSVGRWQAYREFLAPLMAALHRQGRTGTLNA